ncbi:cell division protein FtsA [Ammoniphilus sp. CFH 90114]|nr:cell division protein FtsA [Ammoniphilus sp. CFH 90114]
MIEHKERSMLDGQIHDVIEVSRVIQQVKDRLSERNGPLKEVAVAAAGRSLKTKRVTFDQFIGDRFTLTRDDVLAMELAAVQEAQLLLAKEQKGSDFSHYYCVGYSTVNYYLDDDMIGNLVHQRGNSARVDVIATFLPRVVVDSLITALQLAELEMSTLTLEPIAAIHVLIPSTMRKLNIALVDIGAGTSDVAITAEGTITAYGMVPYAGDEITEALSEAFILDFPDAEEVKRKLAHTETISFTDILGMDYSLSPRDIVSSIESNIDELSKGICQKILELNAKAPQAVMLIGGGSLTPMLPEKLATLLGLPPARVAVRNTEAIKNLTDTLPHLDGPEYVTPIGIAVAAHQHPVRYVSVTVNGEMVRLFDLKPLTIGDVLLHLGFDLKRLNGRPGLAISITVNGKVRFIPGRHGSSAKLTRNHEQAHLDTFIQDQDKIQIEMGQDGDPPEIRIQNFMEEIGTLDVYLDGELVSLMPDIELNGQVVTDCSRVLEDRDGLHFAFPQTVQEVLTKANQLNIVDSKPWIYSLNGVEHTWESREIGCYINHQPASLHSRIKQGDRIWIQCEEKETPFITTLIPKDAQPREIEVNLNGKQITLSCNPAMIKVNGQPVHVEQRLQPNDKISAITSEQSCVIFSDIFRFIDTQEIPKPDGATELVIRVNEVPASYQTAIRHGDSLELYWDCNKRAPLS